MSKQCSLRRAFGKWPTKQFQALAKEQQDAFYRDVASLTGAEMMNKAREVSNTTFDEHSESFYDRGLETCVAD